MHKAINHKKQMDARNDRANDGIEPELRSDGTSVVRIAHEEAPHCAYELKVLQQHRFSDLEYFTYQMTSTHNCSDDALHDC